MVGAHLGAVNEGPGIQDNGSGSAAIPEVALQMAKVQPRNRVRFAWWGADESGLVGSNYYVDKLTQVAQDRIALYLNIDMIGSPNPQFFNSMNNAAINTVRGKGNFRPGPLEYRGPQAVR